MVLKYLLRCGILRIRPAIVPCFSDPWSAYLLSLSLPSSPLSLPYLAVEELIRKLGLAFLDSVLAG